MLQLVDLGAPVVVWLHTDPWPQKNNISTAQARTSDQFTKEPISLSLLTRLKCTCGEHARVGVGWGETHVLLDASAGPLGRPLDRQVLGRLHYPLPRAAVVVNSLHSAVQWWLEGLQLGGGFPQQEACHKLAQHWWTLILLKGKEWG